jgi:WS/DGAT/MGAT family acyltransferase
VGEQLSALDATFLELEEADQSAHMHIGGVILLDPLPTGGAPPLELVRRDVLARVPDMPHFTQRLSQPHTGGLHWPSWEQDPDFDVSRHVFAAGLHAPGRRYELLEWASEFFSVRLDRTKPLWELAVVELSDGTWAMVTKTHHCMLDGIASVDIGQTLLDSTPFRPRTLATILNGGPDKPDAPPPETPSDSLEPRQRGRIAGLGRSLAQRGVRVARTGVQLAESAVGVATHPSRARETLTRARALAELIARDEVIAAPDTSLNRPIGAKRRLGVISADLDDLRSIKRQLGGTINDVVLAAAAGGFRALLLHRGEEPPARGLRAMVPVNVRTAADQIAQGNRISSLFVHLPVAPEDAGERYSEQLHEAEELKAGTQATGSSTLIELTSHLPPVLHSFMARSMYATRLFNVTITNVPGPQSSLYSFGSRVREIWPLVPLAAEHAVGLAVFSYDGRLYFCLNADRDTVPDLEVLIEGISESLRELAEVSGVRLQPGG